MCTWKCINVELQIPWRQRYMAIFIGSLSLNDKGTHWKAGAATAADMA